MAMNMSELSNLKFLKDLIPKYDGNPKTLNYFIREVERTLSLLEPAARAHAALICLIKSRLSGAAIDAVAYEESLDTWQQIKDALLRRLGEPRNEIQLMQELTRVRRNRNEDAETLGKRLRDILDTFLSVGKHTDKSYYENMVIDQYINSLDFHVSIGVRIARPETLEKAIISARQEEARLTFNKQNNNFYTPHTQSKPKDVPRMDSVAPHTSQSFGFNNFSRFSNPNIMLQRTNNAPQQKQQPRAQALTVPWQNKPTTGMSRSSGGFKNSGNFRQQPNMPQQQVNPPQKVSDVTMRSVDKPAKPQFGHQGLFFTVNEPDMYQNDFNPYYEQGECSNSHLTQDYFDSMSEEQSNCQDFPLDTIQEDHS